MRVVPGLTWLLGCQLAGEVLAHATGAPVPGAVLGMVVLLVVLLVRRREDTSAHVAADALLPHLQLLFIVPGVGVVAYGAVIGADCPSSWPLSGRGCWAWPRSGSARRRSPAGPPGPAAGPQGARDEVGRRAAADLAVVATLLASSLPCAAQRLSAHGQ